MAKKRILNNPDLSNRNIFFNDTSNTSPDVFRITQFPSTLTSGKNIIKLQGNPSNLNVGSVLEIWRKSIISIYISRYSRRRCCSNIRY